MADSGLHYSPGTPACRRTTRGVQGEALGRSRGGFSTKIHIAVDGLGNPVKFTVSGGQEADITHAPTLLEGQAAEVVIADKAFDKQEFVSQIERQGGTACIPSLKNRKEQREYDRELYKERNRVERFINRIKHYRQVATRYEKTARNFLAFVHVAAALVLLL